MKATSGVAEHLENQGEHMESGRLAKTGTEYTTAQGSAVVRGNVIVQHEP